MALLAWTSLPVMLARGLAGAIEQLLPDPGLVGQRIPPHREGHHHFLQGRVARPLTDAVDGALHLPRTGHHRGQGVRSGQPQVVVAVDAEGGLVDAGDVRPEMGDQASILVRHGVAHGVGDVQHRRPGLQGNLADLHQEVPVAAGGVFGGELHVRGEGLGQGHALPDHLQGLGPGLLELVGQVDIRGGQESVDPGLIRVLEGLPGPLDVPGDGPAERGNDRPATLPGDGLHRGEVVLRGHGEASLDDIHLERLQLAGHLQLLFQVHAATRRLLAVPEGRVEDGDPLGTHRSGGLPGPASNGRIN